MGFRMKFGVAAGIVLTTSLVARGQQPTETFPGFRSPATYDSSQIDNIDLYGGDIGVRVPLGPSYPLGPNFSWGLTAYATDKIWNFISDDCGTGAQRALIHGLPTLGAGWTLELGHIENAVVGGGTYVSPDGGHHTGTPSTDGSRLRIRCQTTTSCTVETPDGTVYHFTHPYTIPRPTAGSSVDFNYVEPAVAAPQQVGLTSITNHFGKTLLSVSYSAGTPWEVSTIDLEPGTAQARSITYTYGTTIISGVTWQVLTQLSLPSAAGAGHSLTIGFTYDTTPITRNNFDNVQSGSGGCSASGTSANVPTLLTITYSDGSAVLQAYSFTYQHGAGDADGILNHIGLPTGGTIDYSYDSKVMHNHFTGVPTDLESSAVDPPSFAPTQAPPAPLIATCGDKRNAYTDRSAAVIERIAKASSTDTGIITEYARDEYDTADPCTQDGYLNSTRRTLVLAPNGDGTSHYVKYLFHVPDVLGEDPTSAGFEIERRYYADTDFGGTPVRTIVNCQAGNSGNGNPVCGFLANATTVQSYGVAGQVRRQASVTWYGESPTGGGTCSGTAPPCTAVAADTTTYSTTALKYGKWTTTSTLPPMSGWTSRSDTTALAPYTDGTDGTNGHWFLDLWSSETKSDAGAPAPSSVTTTANFSTSTGFQNNQGVADSYGGVTTYYTSNDGTAGDPTTIETKGTSPITGDYVDTCSYQSGLVTSCTRTGMSWKAIDLTRENNTGAVTVSKDPNGLQTQFSHDALGRTTKILPPPNNEVTIVATRTCYLLASDNSSWNPNSLNFVMTKTGSTDGNACYSNDGAALTWTAVQLDGLGRPIREYRMLPNNLGSNSQWAIRDTTYDLAGNVASVSEWTPCVPNGSGLINIGYCAVGLSSNNPSQKTTYSAFDIFGRPQTITNADGSGRTITRSDDLGHNTLPPSDATCAIASYTCIRFSDTLEGDTVSVNGSNATTVIRNDTLGRVIGVQEPAVAGAADQTLYKYGVLDQLATVTAGSQTRSFTLDARGWLRSETNPENGTTSYTSYNALGGVLSKTEGVSPSQVISTLTYDNAGRVLTLSTNESGGRTYIQNTYDLNKLSSPPSPNYPLGQLTEAVGWNYPLDPGPRVIEDYGFGGPGGRVSKRVASIGSDSDVNDGAGVRDGEGIQATETWTYNTLGLIASYNHPRSSGTYPEADSYSLGLPSGATGNGWTVYSTLSYNPFGGFASWKAGNNVTTTIGQDAHLLPRPSSISTSGASANFTSGSYSYDGAGNILSIGTDAFTYDSRSRVTQSNYGTLGYQTFAYDRYANLTARKTYSQGGTLLNDQEYCTTSTCTNYNHVTGQSYDTRGNLTTGLTVDGLNRLKVGNGWAYLYDAAGERVAKFPDQPVLRREMAKLIVQARNENPVSTGCTGAVDTVFYADVACSDPDRVWIDQVHTDGIANGYGGGVYGPGSSITRGEMSAFLAKGKLAPNPVPTSGYVNGVFYNCISGGSSYFDDVAPTDVFCATVNYIASVGITQGCGTDPNPPYGPIYCPTQTTPESQMMAFTRRGWPNYLYVPRGTIYTLRDASSHIASEFMSTPGSTSYPNNDFPIATTPTRDNVFLGNLLAGSYVSSSLGGSVGWEYFHADHLGSPRITTNASASTVETDKYWPYGDPASMTGTDQSQRLKFALMENDSEATRYYDHARTHDYSLGRFMSKDVLAGNVILPSSLNRYGYAIGNPMKFVDPLGLDPDPNASSAEERSPDPQNEYINVWDWFDLSYLGNIGQGNANFLNGQYQAALRSAADSPGEDSHSHRCSLLRRIIGWIPPFGVSVDVPFPWEDPVVNSGGNLTISVNTQDMSFSVYSGVGAVVFGDARLVGSADLLRNSSTAASGARFQGGVNLSGAAKLSSTPSGFGGAASYFFPVIPAGRPEGTAGPARVLGNGGSLTGGVKFTASLGCGG